MEAFERLQGEIREGLYLASHESQPTQLAGSLYCKPPKSTCAIASKNVSFKAYQFKPIWTHANGSVGKPPRRDTESGVLGFA